MPYIVTGEPTSHGTYDYSKSDHNYDYPYGLNLKPGSDLHEKLRSRIWERASESRNEMSKRYPSWREIDRTMTVYVDLKSYEENLQSVDESKPVSIVFPYSYSMHEALLTYFSLAFFQDPMFQYEGVEDDDAVGGMLMELLIRLHCIKSKVALNLHTSFSDSFKYGLGVVTPDWVVKRGRRPVRSSIITESAMGQRETNQTYLVEDILFEGNALNNIDPYMYLPDVSVSSNNVQKGEFVAWIERDNYMNVLSEENDPKNKMFNVKYLTQKRDKRSTLALDQSDRETKFGGSSDTHRGMTFSTNPVDRLKMYITLIPKEWELSDREIPEKWFFELDADDIIVACERAEHNHGMYPVGVASPEFDGYSITPIGRMEILHGLQHTLNFLFNSHIANVRKAINDMLVVDPYLVNIKDLEDPKPGKLIRLRRPAWGRGIDKVVQQLQVNDITRLNISDSTYITQWMDRISGADQSMQGAMRQGGPERLTGIEFQGTRGSAISRLQRLAMIVGMQMMQDVGTMFAVHTQQYMEKTTYVRTIGQHAEKLYNIFKNDRVRVTPYDISVNYDLIVRDGSIPGGNFSQAWVDLFKIIGTNPELAQQFDVTRIFLHIAHQLGAKNVEDFKRNVGNMQATTMPDGQVEQQAQAGNIVPAGAI